MKLGKRTEIDWFWSWAFWTWQFRKLDLGACRFVDIGPLMITRYLLA